MKILLLFFVLLSSLYAELDWPHDYNKALERAKKEKKDLYMLITSQNCRWCRKFEDTTLQDEETIAQLELKYVLLHINRDKDYLPERFKSKRVPRHYFVTAQGQIIYTFLGYWDKEDFASFLADVEDKR